MRTVKIILCVGLLTAGLTGCKPVTATLPAGAINSFDASSYQTLMTAQATLNTLKVDAPTVEPSVPQYKTVLNQAIADYNTAEAAWQVYHSTGANSAGVTAALAVIATDILKLEGLIPTTRGN